MAEAVVALTLERLGDLLISEAKLLSGIGDQIDEIKAELKKMQCYLQDAEAKQYQNQTIRNWVRDIRQLSYKTEDILETYVVEVASENEKRGIKQTMKSFCCIFRQGMTLHRIGLEIGAIKVKMSKLSTSLQTCNEIKALSDQGSSSGGSSSNHAKWQSSCSMRMSYSHLTQMDFDFVGMEEEIKKLVSFMKLERGCQVVSLWGMGGQGKTTLARKIYNHDDVRSRFHAFAWICISQKYKKKKVLKEILVQLLPDKKGEVKTMGDTELVQTLHKTLQDKDCLVIIDDIWTTSAWKSLEPAFPLGDEATDSKIMLTTRLEQVAKMGCPHKLRSLTEAEGWKLLLKKVFPGHKSNTTANGIDFETEQVGREMVEKCEGLPLAICAIGGILKDKTKLRDWHMLNNDVASYISRGTGDETEDGGTVRQILALSYDNLSYYLKHLFLYLGNFPEDTEIWTSNLYFTWIAEGLIFPHDQAKGEMMLDVAERYLRELAQRSLVQVEPSLEGESWLDFRSCHVHDLIRDLCLLKGKEEDFINVVDPRDVTLQDNMAICRRLAVNLYDASDIINLAPLQQQNVIRQLRSLIFFNPNRTPPVAIRNLKEFKLLRIFRLEKFDFRSNAKLLEGIGELTYLRYLSLFACSLDALPASIGNLKYLESLDLKVRGPITIPHNVLCKMKQLKHLYLPDFIRLKCSQRKLIFDGLTELAMVSKFNVTTCDIKGLVKLTNVRVLRAINVNTLEDITLTINFISSEIFKKRYVSLWCVNIANFGSEEGLSCLVQLLQCAILNQLFIDGHLGRLPKLYDHRLFSERLSSIHLWYCYFEEDPMKLLEKLPNLRVLRLNPYSYVGEEMVCAAKGFPQLTTLELNQLVNLEAWKVEEGAMPNLYELEISCCCLLEMLPDGLRFITSLGVLNLDYMPPEFQDRVRVIDGVEGKDLYKVRHVRSITI